MEVDVRWDSGDIIMLIWSKFITRMIRVDVHGSIERVKFFMLWFNVAVIAVDITWNIFFIKSWKVFFLWFRLIFFFLFFFFFNLILMMIISLMITFPFFFFFLFFLIFFVLTFIWRFRLFRMLNELLKRSLGIYSRLLFFFIKDFIDLLRNSTRFIRLKRLKLHLLKYFVSIRC